MKLLQKLGLDASLVLMVGVGASPAYAAITANALTHNALTHNALTHNALTHNALTHNMLDANVLSANLSSANSLSTNAAKLSGQDGFALRTALRALVSKPLVANQP